MFFFYFNFIKDFTYLFLDRGEGREKERERNINVWLPLAPTGDLAHNPGTCPDWESNRRPFGLQSALNPLWYISQGPMSTPFNQQLQINVVFRSQNKWQKECPSGVNMVCCRILSPGWCGRVHTGSGPCCDA